MTTNACKIIVTGYNTAKIPRKFDVPWPEHSQDGGTIEEYRKHLAYLVELEKTVDPGADIDTFIITVEDAWEEYKNLLQYDGIKTKRGTLRVIVRPEEGGSFGGYDLGFKMFRDKYEWFVLSEDDVPIFGDQYLTKMIEKFQSESNIGHVAAIGLSRPNSGHALHAHGGAGLTHRDVLDAVIDRHKELPHAHGQWNQQRNISEGEIPFTNCMVHLGYKLIPATETNQWRKDMLCYPYYSLTHNL